MMEDTEALQNMQYMTDNEAIMFALYIRMPCFDPNDAGAQIRKDLRRRSVGMLEMRMADVRRRASTAECPFCYTMNCEHHDLWRQKA